MAQSSYITLVEGSTTQTLTLDELKSELNHFMEMTAKTGEQLEWDYNAVAFPYVIEEKPEGTGKWFILKGKDPKMFKYIYMGIGSNEEGNTLIQVTIPEDALQGDMGKGNELARYLAKHYRAQLTLFNGRIQYFNTRK